MYNAFHLLDSDGNVRLSYRKRHLFPLTGEHEFFLTGESNPAPCQAGPWTIGVGICFDLRFPELFRLQVRQGANLFLLPSQFPHPRQDAFRALSRARAMENQACMVCVNRTGKEDLLNFFGGSMLVDHGGNILSEMSGDEGAACAAFRASDLEKSRKDFPFLALTPVLDEMLPAGYPSRSLLSGGEVASARNAPLGDPPGKGTAGRRGGSPGSLSHQAGEGGGEVEGGKPG